MLLVYLQDTYGLAFSKELLKRLPCDELHYFTNAYNSLNRMKIDNKLLHILPKTINYSNLIENFPLLQEKIFNIFQSDMNMMMKMAIRNDYYKLKNHHEISYDILLKISYWYNYLIFNKITHLVIKLPDNLDNFILFKLSKYLNNKILYIGYLPYIKNNYGGIIFSNSLDNLILDENLKFEPSDNFEQLVCDISRESRANVYDTFPSEDQLSVNGLNQRVINRLKRKSVLQWLFTIYSYLKNTILLNSIKKLINNISVRELPKDFKFVFFPLQLQPEASTEPHAGFYSDYKNSVSLVASKLNKNEILVIKEHPAYFSTNSLAKFNINNYRSREFYLKLVSLPNVILVNNDFNTLDLIQESEFVVTTNGTVILESLSLDKNVVLLGSHYYSSLPNVYSINEEEDMVEVLNSARNKLCSPSDKSMALKIISQYYLPINEPIGKNFSYETLELILSKIVGFYV